MIYIFYFFAFYFLILYLRPQTSSALFFRYNTQLGPPYHVLIDTNFINFSIKNKLDIIQSMMDCMYAKCVPYITDCVMAELEKLGQSFRIALRIAKDVRFERLPCMVNYLYIIIKLFSVHLCYFFILASKPWIWTVKYENIRPNIKKKLYLKLIDEIWVYFHFDIWLKIFRASGLKKYYSEITQWFIK